MPMHTQLISRSTHPRRSLLALGGLARTFGSLASFLALTFLGVGVYIMQDAFADPLAAQATPLVASAFIIALASIILFYLFKSRRTPRTRRVRIRQEARPNSASYEENAPLYKLDASSGQMRPPYQRRSTDHVQTQL